VACHLKPGQFTVRTGLVKSSQVKSCLVKVRSDQVRSGQVKLISGQDKTDHDRCGQVHVRSGHIISYQEKINSGQVEREAGRIISR